METNTNWSTIQGHWNDYKGRIKEKWGKLTDLDLEQIEGNRDRLIGMLQTRCLGRLKTSCLLAALKNLRSLLREPSKLTCTGLTRRLVSESNGACR